MSAHAVEVGRELTFPRFAMFEIMYESVVKRVLGTVSDNPSLIYVFWGYVIDTRLNRNAFIDEVTAYSRE